MSYQARQLELVDVSHLVPFRSNARAHSKKQIEKIACSMKERGVTNPLLIDEDNVLLAGHGRLCAAKTLGLKQLPCIRIIDMNDADKRAYRLADNQIALESAWDVDLLAGELSFLVDIEWDVGLTGFDDADVDRILADFEDRTADLPSADDAVPPLHPDTPPVTRPGDLWLLGHHRLLCGNARSTVDLDRLMEGGLADMAFTDAPYNVPIDGHVCGNGAVQHREFAEASGEMSREEFTVKRPGFSGGGFI